MVYSDKVQCIYLRSGIAKILTDITALYLSVRLIRWIALLGNVKIKRNSGYLIDSEPEVKFTIQMASSSSMVELTNSLISPLICALLCNKTKRKPYPILIACKFNIDNFTSYTNTLSHARIKMNSEGLIGSSMKFVNFRIKRNFGRLID